MQVIGTLEEYTLNFNENSSKIVLNIHSNDVNTLEKLRGLKLNVELKQFRERDLKLNVELKQFRKKRSLDANSYCWVLCDHIAKALTEQGAICTKEDIYKDAITQIGVFQPMIVEEKAFDKFQEIWKKQGLGYLVQEVSRKDKCVKVHCYYGSSSYDTKEMSLLINILVDLAKSLGVETRPQAEIDSLLKEGK